MKLGLGLSIPGAVAQQRGSAQKAYSRAVFRLDARFNPSTGAPTDLSANALTVQNGSTSGADANDALYLPAPSTYGVSRYVYLPGIAGNYLSAPDEAALDITGDIDLRVHCALDDWTPTAMQVLVSKWGASTPTNSYYLGVQIGGALLCVWTEAGGTARVATSTANPTVSDGASLWVRATVDVDNGASQYTVTFFTSADGVSWSQLGAPVVGATGVTDIVSGSAVLNIGSRANTDNPLQGRLFRAQVYSGINGSKVFDWSAEDTVTATHSAFTASTGQTVTVNRATSGRKTAVVEAAKWALGTDDYIEVQDSDLLDFTNGEPGTILAVIRQHATPTSFGRLVSKRGTTAPAAGWELANNGTGASFFGILSDGTAAPSRTSSSYTTGAIVSAGIRLSGTHIMMFVNGTIDAQATTSAVTTASRTANPVRIGRTAEGTASYQDFELYAVYVWREALTASELAAIAADWGAA